MNGHKFHVRGCFNCESVMIAMNFTQFAISYQKSNSKLQPLHHRYA